MGESIGKTIKEKRVTAGLSQGELAKKIGGCSSSYISAVERGATEVSLSKALSFADALGCSVQEIVGTNRTRKVGKPAMESNNESYVRYAHIRDSRGMSDADVAVAAGITPSVLSHWKLYGTNPKDMTIERISRAINCEPEDFIVADDGSGGNVTMSLSPSERDVLYKYRHAPNEVRVAVWELLKIEEGL